VNGVWRSADAGFSLMEVLISTAVLTTGLVGVAHLMAVSVSMNTDSRFVTNATEQAQAKIDELMKSNFTAPSLQISATDTLAANVTNYFDTSGPNVTRRWRVVAGPSGTRTVTVRVLDTRARLSGRTTEITTMLRQW
jgi:prepilin-type N-terminal cleavage/methylation domain-containing protein